MEFFMHGFLLSQAIKRSRLKHTPTILLKSGFSFMMGNLVAKLVSVKYDAHSQWDTALLINVLHPGTLF
jgi:hypothetical protein